jgi:SAM-dependent methyltransferase
MTEYPFDHDDDSAIGDELRRARFVKCGIYDAPAWYDVDYAGYRGEEAFYRLVLRGHARPDGIVVELGAGTGRLALQLAADGHRVHGVEPAAPMRALLEANRKKAELAQLSVADGLAATFVPPRGRIDIVMFPFNGLLHLQTRVELLASFRHVCCVLDDDGRFALDCTGPYWDAILYGPMPWGRSDVRVHPEHGRTVLTCDRSIYDASTRQMRIDIRYVFEGDDEGTEIMLRQTMWTWQEVLSALDESGFTVDTIYGDVDLTPFDEGSPRLLVSARKR